MGHPALARTSDPLRGTFHKLRQVRPDTPARTTSSFRTADLSEDPMKKLMLLGAVMALAASALPGAAAAGQFTGVVVAKDSARQTIAVVIGKQVRTVRIAKTAKAAVGQRVTVTGARL